MTNLDGAVKLTPDDVERIRQTVENPPDGFNRMCNVALAYLAAAQPQEAVAEVTYSNWNGITIAALPRGDELRLPVGTKLYASPAAAEGMVPAEPTDEMFYAFKAEWDRLERRSIDAFTAAYKAMIAAAPAQPGQEKEHRSVSPGTETPEYEPAHPPLAQDGREALNGAHGYAGAKQAFLNSANVEYPAPAASLTTSERPGAAGLLREAREYLEPEVGRGPAHPAWSDLIARIDAHLAAEGQT